MSFRYRGDYRTAQPSVAAVVRLQAGFQDLVRATRADAAAGQDQAFRDVRLDVRQRAEQDVADVEKSAAFYKALLGLKEVSRPGNGGINLGLSDGFLGLYKLPNPGTVNHFCIGVDDFDPDRMAERLKAQGIAATVDRNPANRTSGGDQLYFTDPDKTRVQLGPNGYQG